MAGPMTSEDGKVQIIRHSITYPPMGPKAVQGAIKNLSNAPVNVEIVAEFYDENEQALGKSSLVVKDLAVGETRLFDIWAERLPNMYETESHKIISLKVI